MSERTINVTISHVITVDGIGIETEAGPTKYQAHYWEHKGGQVSVTEFRLDGVRAKMSEDVHDELARVLEDQIAKEREQDREAQLGYYDVTEWRRA